MYVLSLSKQLSEPVHHIGFMFHKRMGITVECDRRVLVSEDLGERLYIHTAFDGAGGKCMPQGMKSLMRNI